MITAFVCCKMRMMECQETDVTLYGAERTVSLRTEQLHVINCLSKVCTVFEQLSKPELANCRSDASSAFILCGFSKLYTNNSLTDLLPMLLDLSLGV